MKECGRNKSYPTSNKRDVKSVAMAYLQSDWRKSKKVHGAHRDVRKEVNECTVVTY